MPKSGSELLFLALIIAGFMLFNYVAQRLAKAAREQQDAAKAARGQQEVEAAVDASVPPPEDAPLEDIWGRVPVPRPAAPAPVACAEPQARAAPPRPLPRRTGARLFRTRKDLQHAIVLMTVLGPCRALEPHERR